MNRLFGLGIVLIIGGCGGKWLTGIDSDYPRHWGQFVKVAESECPDLSGGWSNSGTVSYSHSQWSPLLSYHLTGSRATPVGLRITSEQDQLLIRLDVNADGSAKPATELRRGEDYKCEEGALWLKPKVTSAADGTGGYRATKTLGFRKTTDGSLIGEERLSSVGAALWVIPVAGSQTFWYRWWPYSNK